jgi:hypothetical protein
VALTEKLGSPDWAQRNEASERLVVATEGVPLDSLVGLLSDPGLTPERRLRLTRAARERFVREARGGLGIRMHPDSVAGSGIKIEHVDERFPAFEVLRVGDAILGADGVSVASNLDFRAMILSHDPGEEMSLRILREGDESQVKVRLGSYSDLNEGTRPDDLLLIEAWRLRLLRCAPLAEEAPLDGGYVPAERYQPPRFSRRNQGGRRTGTIPVGRQGVPDYPIVVAGGEARGGVEPSMAGPRTMRQGPMNVRRMRPVGPGPGMEVLRQEVEILRMRRETLRETLTTLRLKANDPSVGADDKRTLDVIVVQEVSRELEAIESEIRAGEAQLKLTR